MKKRKHRLWEHSLRRLLSVKTLCYCSVFKFKCTFHLQNSCDHIKVMSRHYVTEQKIKRQHFRDLNECCRKTKIWNKYYSVSPRAVFWYIRRYPRGCLSILRVERRWAVCKLLKDSINFQCFTKALVNSFNHNHNFNAPSVLIRMSIRIQTKILNELQNYFAELRNIEWICIKPHTSRNLSGNNRLLLISYSN